MNILPNKSPLRVSSLDIENILGAHTKTFFWQWLRNPKETGAISPSSIHLARTMAAQVGNAANETIIELGAGTGVITQALVQIGLQSSQLLIVEKNLFMVDTLRRRFPGLRIVQEDVTRLSRVVLDEGGMDNIKTIVSGLPMLLFDSRKQYVILKQAFKLLAPNGFFLQFTYGPTPPVSRQVSERLGITSSRVAFVWRNMPPAIIWRLELSRPHGRATSA